MPKSFVNQFDAAVFRPTDVLTTKESLNLATLVAINPNLFTVVDEVIAQPTVHGKPRGQMTAPVAPNAQVEDTLYFEEPTNPALRYYLPRYRLATERVSGALHYRVRMAEVSGQWRLELTLEAFAAPALGAVPPETRVLPHELGVRLRWQIRNTGGATRELIFTERLANPDGTILFALTLATLPEHDAVYTALTEQAAQASLVIQRLVRVAVSTTANQSASRNTTGMLKLQPNLTDAILTRPGDFDVVQRPLRPIDKIIIDRPPIFRPDWTDEVILRPDKIKPFIPALPTPVVEITGWETFEAKGATYVRYRLRVSNWQAYGDDLFVAAPDLPPCGQNTNASRTWVDIFNSSNQRIYGFCALGRASDLENLWVAVRLDTPVQGFYIELVDRRANLSARSNIITPPPLDLYEEVTRNVEAQEALFFNPGLHSYIFQGFTQSTSTRLGLIARQANFNGRWHGYFQDEVQPHRFYYLPDAFKLARRPDGNRTPLLRLELLATAPEQYRLTYVAMPAFDWDRLEAAEIELQRHIPAGHGTSITLEPFQTNAVTFVPFEARLYSGGTTTSINLSMVQSTVTLTQDDFLTVWDDLNGVAAPSLSGKIQVTVQGFPAQEIPVTLRLDDTVGELLAITTAIDAPSSSFRLTLKNAIESPLQITTLGAFVQSATRGMADVRPATWHDLILPATLSPGNELAALLAPPAGAAVQDFIPLVDTDQVRVLPATEAIFDAMISNSVRDHQRPVKVQVPTVLFNHASGKILALQVTFVGGETVILTPPSDTTQGMVSATAQVRYPLRKVLLREAIGDWYQYSVVVAWEDGKVSPPSAPLTDHAEQFLLRVPQLN